MSTRCLMIFFDAVDDRDGVAAAALFQNRDVYRFLPVNSHDVGLNRSGIFGLAHIRHHHGAQPHAFQRNLSSDPLGSFTWLLA